MPTGFLAHYRAVKRWTRTARAPARRRAVGVRPTATASAVVAERANAALHGFYDCSRVAELEAVLASIEPSPGVAIDLANASHLDCASLGLLIRRLREWRKNAPETQLELQNVQPRLLTVLKMLKLDKVFIVREPD